MLPLGLGAAASFGCPGADEIALHIGKPTQNRERQAPGAGAGVGPRLRQGSELRLGVYDTLDDAEQVEGAAGEAVDARHCYHVAGGPAGRASAEAPAGGAARPWPSRGRCSGYRIRRRGAAQAGCRASDRRC